MFEIKAAMLMAGEHGWPNGHCICIQVIDVTVKPFKQA